MNDCRMKAQIKISTPNGWVGIYCFRHTMSFLRSQLRNIRLGFAIYMQRYVTPEEAEAARRRALSETVH